MRFLKLIVAAAAFGCALAAPSIEAANRGWTGGAGNGLLSDARNWLAGVPPGPGDRIAIQSSSAQQIQVDVANATFVGMDFGGPGEITLTGNPITLTADHPITVNTVVPGRPGTFTFATDLYLAARNAVIEVEGGGGNTLAFGRGKRLIFAGGDVQMWANGFSAAINVFSDIREESITSFTLYGENRITFGGDNSFTGQITTYSTLFIVEKPAALGSAQTGTLVGRGDIRLNGGSSGAAVTFQEPITVRYPGGNTTVGSGMQTTGSVALSGSITGLGGSVVAQGELFVDAPLGGGPFYGSIAFGSTGSGLVTFRVPSPGYTGDLSVTSGRVRFAASGMFPAARSVGMGPGGVLMIGETVQTFNEFHCTGGTLSITLGVGKIVMKGISQGSGCVLDVTVPSGVAPAPGTVIPIVETPGGNTSLRIDGWDEGTITTVGNLAVRVTYVAGESHNNFALVVVGALRVLATSGPVQLLAVGELAPDRFVARAVDGSGAPLTGVSLVFASSCGTFAGANSATVAVDSAGYATSPLFRVGFAPGDCTVTASLPSAPASTRATFVVQVYDPAFVVQDLWWSGTAENGWGMSIVQHKDTLFSVIYAYDSAGKPIWYVMSGGAWNAMHTAYTGELYVPHGAPFFAYDATRFSAGPAVGSATLTFADMRSATLDYSINGTAGRKSMTRNLFGPSLSGAFVNHGDMWWGGSAQNGWGVVVLQQFATLFSVWFTYDAAGNPTWFVMPGGTWTTPDIYDGRLYRTTSSPWLGAPYDPTRLSVVDVGPYRLSFSGDAATFEYTVEGRTGTLPLSRLPF